jgi:hypothetical protein
VFCFRCTSEGLLITAEVFMDVGVAMFSLREASSSSSAICIKAFL